MKKKSVRKAYILLAFAICAIISIAFISNRSQADEEAGSMYADAPSDKTIDSVPAPMQEGQETEWQAHNGPDTLFEIPVFTHQRKGQRIKHTGYTVHFNTDWHIPNWVAYQLTCNETQGEEERGKHFRPDPDVSEGCPTTHDYTNSGYDRGHMAPAGDMKWDRRAMDESFYMSNICPQNHNLNAGDWKTLEEKVRDWACEYGPVYVVCGPIDDGSSPRIGEAKVLVPKAFYKVLLCRRKGKWQSIGFVYENKAGHKPLRSYCVSVDSVEKLTGTDFFFLIDDATEDTIESTCRPGDWNL